MNRIKQQRGLGADIDRVTINLNKELGNKVRKEANLREMSISNFLSKVIKTYFNLRAREK